MRKTEFTKEKISLVTCLVLLFCLFFQIMRPFWMSLIVSAIFVVLFYPTFEKLKHKTKKPRLSAFLLTLAIFLIILLPATLTVTLVINQSYAILQDVDPLKIYRGFFESSFYQSTVLPYWGKVQSYLPFAKNDAALLSDFGKRAAGVVSQFSPKLLFGTAGFFFDFFIMLVSIYFLFLEGHKLLDLVYDISPMRDSHERRLFKELKNTIDASVQGYLLTSLVQAFLATFAFYISGIPGSAVLGMLTFFMSMVPIVGATGVWVPVCVGLFLNHQTAYGIFILVWGLFVISGIDNVLKPLIIQGRTRIHPLLVFFSLFGGIAWFGPLGILFGPVITAILIATVKIYRDEFVT